MFEVRQPGGEPALFDYDEFERAVLDGEIGPQALVRFPPVTGDREMPAGELALYRSLRSSPRFRFQQGFTLRRVPQVSVGLSLLLVAAWTVQQRDAPLNGAVLLAQGAKSLPHQWELGQWWRLITANLLHAYPLHLVANVAYLLYAGWSVESVLGRSSTALLITASGLGGMALSSVATPTATVGASGLVFGLFGALIALGWRFGPWMHARVRKRFGWAVAPFVLYFVVAGLFFQAGTDNFCHLGGLIVGGILGLWLPSSLIEPPGNGTGPAARVLVTLGLLVAVGLGLPAAWAGGLLGGAALRSTPELLQEEGVWVRPPVGWTRRPDGATWESPTGAALMRLMVRRDVRVPADAGEIQTRWLRELESSGASTLPIPDRGERALGLPDGWVGLEVDLDAPAGRYRVFRAGLLRGLYTYTLEFVHPVGAYQDYAALRRDAVRALRIGEPGPVRRARHLAPTEAGLGPDQAAQLAVELAHLGEADQALDLLRLVEAAEPTHEALLQTRLWVALYLDRWDAVDDPVAAARALGRSRPEDAQATALAAEVLWRQGELDRASALLDRMELRWPQGAATRRVRQLLLGPPAPR